MRIYSYCHGYEGDDRDAMDRESDFAVKAESDSAPLSNEEPAAAGIPFYLLLTCTAVYPHPSVCLVT